MLRQAADRGVTICFADLDGADGLWVPEERTILVSRRLSERKQAEVVEHELGHVRIDDGHAELDSGVGRSPRRRTAQARSRAWAAGLTAAACMALLGGVVVGLRQGTGGQLRPDPVVAPTAPPLTGPDLNDQRASAPAVVPPPLDQRGRTVFWTVTPRAPAALTPSRSASGSATSPTPSSQSKPPAAPTSTAPRLQPSPTPVVTPPRPSPTLSTTSPTSTSSAPAVGGP